MPLFWLRIAVIFYGVALCYALGMVMLRREGLSRAIVPLLATAWVVHTVSLTETALLLGRSSLLTIHQSESLLGWILMATFLAIYGRYRMTSPALFVVPAVFLLALSAALAQAPPEPSSPIAKSGWLIAHVALIFVGYSALFLSFVSSVLYLMQERSLKSKRLSGFLTKLPSLQTIDEMGYRTLIAGFPFITLGLIMGSVLAEYRYGPMFFRDPKIVLSVIVWVLYMGLLYMRWSSGWRGRRAAYVATFAFAAAICAYAANLVSGVHRFVLQ